MRYSFVADHFQYLASIGLIALLAGWRRLRWQAGVAVIVLLATLSWRAEGSYADAARLWKDTLAKNPDAWMARNNYALILMARGQLDEAAEHLRRSQEIFPGAPETARNLGLILQRREDCDEAAKQFEREVELEDADAEYQFAIASKEASQGHSWRAGWYRNAGQRRAGRRAAARADLATALVKLGRAVEAETILLLATEFDPQNADVLNTLGTIWAKRGEIARAMGAFRQAAELQPDSAGPYNNIGMLLMEQERAGEAVVAFEKAVSISPNFAPAKRNLEAARRAATQPG
jgi:Flp pilus assembly protein TadD